MFRDILIPLDGSRFAEAALPFGARLAQRARARLHLMLAHEPMGALVGMGDLVVPPPELDEGWRERERAYLGRTAEALRAESDRPVGLREAAGAAGPEICEEASRLEADLVIMATHGRGTFRRMWLGSVSDYVIRHMAVPVLLVPPRPDGTPSPDTGVRRILVGLDLSADAEAILEPVAELAMLHGASVTLMHVAEIIFEVGKLTGANPVVMDSGLLEASRAEAEIQLERVAKRLRERGITVETRVVTGINAAGGLLEALAHERFDLVALTTHGRGGLRRLLLGSVADKVIRGAATPVLVLRPPLA
ncbi:MAG TPA: universal stress protein [Gemmatimonadales bacterium]|nr:universal stress protein [Gemmatimonadales bacterium]